MLNLFFLLRNGRNLQAVARVGSAEGPTKLLKKGCGSVAHCYKEADAWKIDSGPWCVWETPEKFIGGSFQSMAIGAAGS